MSDEARSLIDSILGVTSSPQKEARAEGRAIPDTADPRLARTIKRRIFKDALRIDYAAEALRELPAEDETLHLLSSGQFGAYELIPATLRLIAPATITQCYLATLGFNDVNARGLIALLNEGKIRDVRLILSLLYEADPKEAAACNQLMNSLPEHGGWYCSTRNHAKVVAMRLSDGRHYVFESSANLRRCRAIEQYTISAGADIYDFHASWMEGVRAFVDKEKAAGRQGDFRGGD